ncbi:MAG: M10 family metallopeptidase C-terminal domain-containing protein, partial [Hyphomicrobium sp.]
VDDLRGGAGIDTFAYRSVNDSGIGDSQRDFILDFEQGVDKISLALIDADLSTAGDQSFIFIGQSAFSATGFGQVRFFQIGTLTIIEIDRQGDADLIPEMEIKVSGNYTLSNFDLVL